MAYEGVEVQFHSLPTSSLVAGEWSASRRGALPRESVFDTAVNGSLEMNQAEPKRK